MSLLNLFRRKKKETDLSTGVPAGPVFKMSNTKDAGVLKMAYLAIGKTIADAEKAGEDLDFITAFKRSRENFTIIQNQLPQHGTDSDRKRLH